MLHRTGPRAVPGAPDAITAARESHLSVVGQPVDGIDPRETGMLDRILNRMLDNRPCFEIWYSAERRAPTRSGDGDWRWTLRSPYGTILASGSGYGCEADCRTAIASLQASAATADVVLLADA